MLRCNGLLPKHHTHAPLLLHWCQAAAACCRVLPADTASVDVAATKQSGLKVLTKQLLVCIVLRHHRSCILAE
jgi:hypothetical protein